MSSNPSCLDILCYFPQLVSDTKLCSACQVSRHMSFLWTTESECISLSLCQSFSLINTESKWIYNFPTRSKSRYQFNSEWVAFHFLCTMHCLYTTLSLFTDCKAPGFPLHANTSPLISSPLQVSNVHVWDINSHINLHFSLYVYYSVYLMVSYFLVISQHFSPCFQQLL